jgi:hypothetical protein
MPGMRQFHLAEISSHGRRLRSCRRKHNGSNAAVLALANRGMLIKQIVVRLGYSQLLVSQIIRGERLDDLSTDSLCDYGGKGCDS